MMQDIQITGLDLAAFVDISDGYSVIHFCPNVNFDKSFEDFVAIISHESIHCVLNKIGEYEANDKFDNLGLDYGCDDSYEGLPSEFLNYLEKPRNPIEGLIKVLSSLAGTKN